MAKRRKASQVLGLDRLGRKMEKLAEAASDRNLELALFEGGQVILETAKQNAPKRSGELADSGYVVTASKNNYKSGSGRDPMIKPARREGFVAFSAFWAGMVEYGTDPHVIRGNPVLRMPDGAFVRWARHPGSRAQPYLRPAFDAKRREAVRVIGDFLAARMRKAVK